MRFDPNGLLALTLLSILFFLNLVYQKSLLRLQHGCLFDRKHDWNRMLDMLSDCHVTANTNSRSIGSLPEAINNYVAGETVCVCRLPSGQRGQLFGLAYARSTKIRAMKPAIYLWCVTVHNSYTPGGSTANIIINRLKRD
jgi:hypothetical protein